MRSGWRIILIGCVWMVLLLHIPLLVAQNGTWKNYSNGNYIRGLVERNGELWAATEGGAVRWNPADGSYQKYTTLDGLADSWLTFVLLDRQGFLWFGTHDVGVIRCDPERDSWVNHTERDGLAGDFVNAAMEDSEGNLWFGTAYGLSRLDRNGHWISYTTSNSDLIRDDVDCLAEDAQGNFWFGTRSGVSRYNPGSDTWTSFTSADGADLTDVEAIMTDASGKVWVGTQISGASVYDDGTWINYSPENSGLKGSFVRAFAKEGGNNIWIGTQYNGLFRFDGQNWINYTPQNSELVDNSIRALATGNTGGLWIGTEIEGINRLNDDDWATFQTDDSLGANWVQDILAAEDGTLWIAAFGGGVSKVDKEGWTTYNRYDSGLRTDAVSALAQGPDGNLWMGTTAGLSRFDPDTDTWNNYNVNEGLVSNRINALDIAGDGSIWIGTEAGVSHYDGNESWTNYDTGNSGLAHDEILAVLVDSTGKIWFGTGYGAMVFDGTNWTTYDSSNGLDTSSVRDIIEDRDGRFWFGTRSGAYLFDPSTETWTRYLPQSHGFPTNSVKSILEDSNGNIWFGSRLRGALRYDPVEEIWAVYSTAHGLANQTNVFAIEEDVSGHFWLATNSGVSEFAPADGIIRFPQYVDGEAAGRSNRTRVVFRNNQNAVDSGEIRFRRNDGTPATVTINGETGSSFPFTVPAWGSLDLSTTGLGPLGDGTIEIYSPRRDSSFLVANELFDLLGNFVSVNDSPPRMLHQIYASSFDSENTAVAAFNPSLTQSVTLEMALVDHSGVEVARRQLTLVAQQKLARFVTEGDLFQSYFEDHPGGFEGTLNIRALDEGTVSLVGIIQKIPSGALIFFRSAETSPGFWTSGSAATRPRPALLSQSGSSTLVFPQFADGLDNHTRIVLINNSGTSTSGTIQSRNSAGQDSPVAIEGVSRASHPFTISPWGSLSLYTDGSGDLKTGSIVVTASGGDSSGLNGAEVFELFGNFVSVNNAFLRPTHQLVVSVNGEEDTGIALFNPDPSLAVTLDLFLVDDSGARKASAQLTLGPLAQLAQFVTQEAFFQDYFDQHGASFTGTLNIIVREGNRIGLTGLLQKRADGAVLAVDAGPGYYQP